MVPSTTATDNPVEKQVMFVEVEVDVEPAEAAAEAPSFLPAFFFQCVGHIFALAGAQMATLGRLWTEYFPQVAFGEQLQAVIMPPSSLTFLITALLALAEIKSQGQTDFSFQTHAHAIMVSVNSLLIYSLASAAEVAISAAGFNSISVYAIIARIGRIASLCILVASLLSLFYF